jgi:hypothetical protein
MAKMRMTRINIVTGDIDCLPTVLSALSECCLAGEAAELDAILARSNSYFRTQPAFWTAVLYALGWTPEIKHVFKFREDVRNALIACNDAFKRLSRNERVTPSKALEFMLNETVGDYVTAAKLLGIEVALDLPQRFGVNERTFAAINVEYKLADTGEKYTFGIAQLNLFDGCVKELYTPEFFEKQAFVVEIYSPEDQGVAQFSTDLQAV